MTAARWRRTLRGGREARGEAPLVSDLPRTPIECCGKMAGAGRRASPAVRLQAAVALISPPHCLARARETVPGSLPTRNSQQYPGCISLHTQRLAATTVQPSNWQAKPCGVSASGLWLMSPLLPGYSHMHGWWRQHCPETRDQLAPWRRSSCKTSCFALPNPTAGLRAASAWPAPAQALGAVAKAGTGSLWGNKTRLCSRQACCAAHPDRQVSAAAAGSVPAVVIRSPGRCCQATAMRIAGRGSKRLSSTRDQLG